MDQIIQIAVALLGLAGAFETFSKVGLIWKLGAMGVSGVVLINLAATGLAPWAKPRRIPGFGPAPTRSAGRMALGASGLAAIAFLVAAAGCVIVHFYGIEVADLSGSPGMLEASIRGAVPVTDRLMVLLPPSGQAKCFPKDLTPDPDQQARVTSVSPNSPTPWLDITEFRYPQIVGVVCSPRVELSSITLRTEPADVAVFRPGEASLYYRLIIWLGGALWLAGTMLLWLRSR